MPRRSRKGKNHGNTQLNESDLPRSKRPTIMRRGKKWAVYDKNGRLIILGYNRRICQEYADDRVREARQRQKRKS